MLESLYFYIRKHKNCLPLVGSWLLNLNLIVLTVYSLQDFFILPDSFIKFSWKISRDMIDTHEMLVF